MNCPVETAVCIGPTPVGAAMDACHASMAVGLDDNVSRSGSVDIEQWPEAERPRVEVIIAKSVGAYRSVHDDF